MDEARAFTAEPVVRQVLQLGPFTINPATGELRGPAGNERLDPKVMAVLLFLAERAGDVVLREELLESVWPGTVVTDDALSRCIYQLRRHLGRAEGSDRGKVLLETLPKRGYRLNCVARAPVTRRFARRGATPLIAIAALLGTIGGSIAALQRLDYFWRNPLPNARFTRLTDFDGAEQDAAISRDGRFVAFLSDRNGVVDAWIADIETGELRNLTNGRGGEMRNPNVRTVGFSPDGSEVTLWTRALEPSADPPPIRLWSVPSAGGPLRRYLDGVAELAWSPDGTRSVYHPAESGDPLFVTEPNERVGRQIFIARPGLHCHYPQWSPDGAFIYFVYGSVPDEMDVWRIAPTGGAPERITFHNSRVAYPVLLDARTLLYLATAEDGSGPWLYTMDVERRVAHRIASGPQHYTSLAASADGRRLAATITTQRTSLWRVPIFTDRVATGSDASRIEIDSSGGRSPRLGPRGLHYRSPNGGIDGLRKIDLAGGAATLLWDGRRARIASSVAIEANGDRIAFAASIGNARRLHVMSGDGSNVRRLAEDLDVRGNPAWSPDGRWIAIAADRGGGAQLFKIPVTGARPVALVDRYSIDPAWSPDGTFLLYRGAEAGPTFPVLAVTAEGDARAIPSQILPRGARRLAFLPDGKVVMLKGELRRKDFWLVDVDTGEERRLTDLGPEFIIDDFDVSAEGNELVFDRVREESDVVIIEASA